MSKQMNKLMTVSLLVISMLLSVNVFAADTDAHYIYSNEDYGIAYVRYEKYQEITFDGDILPMNVGPGLREVQKRLVKGMDTLLIIRDSGGGYERAFRQFGEALRDVCKNDGSHPNCVFTTVAVGACSSSCVLLFLHGQERAAFATARFGFHRKWMIHPKMTIKTAKGMSNQYIKHGVNEEWLQKNIYIFTDDQVYGTWVEARDLTKSGIVHGLITEADYRAYKRNHGIAH